MNPRDGEFLTRAIRLAMNGRGLVESNPMVGCVLVRDELVIGEGWHLGFGQAHAEPTALANCLSRGNDPSGATAYVTLEPCCHTNKKTPPCAPRLIDAGIAHVVIGCLDPNPLVNGNGVRMLRDAGIDVRHASEEQQAECRQLIAPFLLGQAQQRPYITLKWAQTADGFVAGGRGTRLKISNDRSDAIVHQLRARSDAILVGSGTVLADDPLLTARNVARSRLKHRIVLDRRLRVAPASQLIRSSNYDVNVVTLYEMTQRKPESVTQLTQSKTRLLCLRLGHEGLSDAVRLIADEFDDLTHLLVEPGPTLAQAFFRENLCDRLWVIQSPRSLDDPLATRAPDIPAHFRAVASHDLAGDTLTEYLNTTSPAYFAPTASADAVLAGKMPPPGP